MITKRFACGLTILLISVLHPGIPWWLRAITFVAAALAMIGDKE